MFLNFHQDNLFKCLNVIYIVLAANRSTYRRNLPRSEIWVINYIFPHLYSLKDRYILIKTSKDFKSHVCC